MKFKGIAILIVCTSLSATVVAQGPAKSGNDEVVGSGTPSFLAAFTGPHRIANSSVFQAPDGSLGIGTTTPIWPLHVFSTRQTGAGGYPPIALWAESTSPDTWGGVFSVASSFTGNTIALNGEAYSPNGTGVIGQGGQNGVIGATFGPSGNGVTGAFQPTVSNGGGGVIGTTVATSGFSYGARGDALGASGSAIGVFGQSFSPYGGGGFFQSNSATGGIGLTGVSYATSGFSIGVRGLAVSPTGTGVAVFAVASSPNGVGGLFINELAGTIIDGRVGPAPSATKVFRVDGTGRVYADGGFQPSGADFAESMAVAGDSTKYSVGDLLVIDPTANRRVALAQRPYSTLVAGIYSTKPGLLGTTRTLNEAVPDDEVPLAVVGIVPCKVTAANGPIQIGDLLVTSSTPGHAMKGTARSRMLGAVVGKALEPLPQGTGVIQVLVTLQ